MKSKTLIRLLGVITIVLVVGFGAEYTLLRRQAAAPAARPAPRTPTPAVERPDGGPTVAPMPTATPQAAPVSYAPYTLPVSLGDLGARLVAAGAIDFDRFVQLSKLSGAPLTDAQMTLLTQGTSGDVVFTRDNAQFLLNVFWALGLANSNFILTRGPMVTTGDGEIGRYASTGGWTIGKLTPVVLYASNDLIALTPEQQTRLENVARAVYRPCCDNPTDFPDCNHGMAMLGLLELMAASDSTEAEMFKAASVANTFWFPGQTYEIALYTEHALDTTWGSVEPRFVVSPNVASGSGFRVLHQWLAMNGLIQAPPSGGSSC